MAANTTIAEFSEDLKSKIEAVDEIASQGKDIFAIDDFDAAIDTVEKPAFGIMYEGAARIENQADSKSVGYKSVMVHSLYFAVVIAIEYTGGYGQESMKQVTNVLDALKRAVHGYRGIGSKPWMFDGEAPYKQGDGVVYYIQKWRIDTPLIGDSTT